jgi:hypothetical protein
MKVSSPGDLLGLVPYLLGFRPSESLVLLLIGAGRVRLTARLDLPRVQLPPVDVSRGELTPAAAVPALLGQFRELVEQTNADAMMLVGYSSRPEATRQLLELVAASLEPLGLIDALYVDDARWWSVLRPVGDGPGEGTPYDLDSHPMAAEAVYAGLTAAGGRAEIEARVTGPSAAELAPLERLGHEAMVTLADLTRGQRQELMSAEVSAFVAAPRRLDDAECARLAVLCYDLHVRDVAWVAMDRATIGQHLDLWGQVVARSVAPWELAPLCLFGMAAWISGDGATQNCCTERALGLDPSYTMAGLLDDINRRVLAPTHWDSMAVELRREVLGAAAKKTTRRR